MTTAATLHLIDSMSSLLHAVEPHLPAFAMPKPCQMVIVVKHGRMFSDFCAVCVAHGFVSLPCGTAEEARRHECEIALDLKVAWCRALSLLREGYQPVIAVTP